MVGQDAVGKRVIAESCFNFVGFDFDFVVAIAIVLELYLCVGEEGIEVSNPCREPNPVPPGIEPNQLTCLATLGA